MKVNNLNERLKTMNNLYNLKNCPLPLNYTFFRYFFESIRIGNTLGTLPVDRDTLSPRPKSWGYKKSSYQMHFTQWQNAFED